jgi:hypothetical protein
MLEENTWLMKEPRKISSFFFVEFPAFFVVEFPALILQQSQNAGTYLAVFTPAFKK